MTSSQIFIDLNTFNHRVQSGASRRMAWNFDPPFLNDVEDVPTPRQLLTIVNLLVPGGGQLQWPSGLYASVDPVCRIDQKHSSHAETVCTFIDIAPELFSLQRCCGSEEREWMQLCYLLYCLAKTEKWHPK